MGAIFSPPKPKKDKKQEKMLEEQLANEKKKGEQADRALMSSRRARNATGTGRTGLGYVAPSGQPGGKLG
jgi:hypothetical protein